MPLCFSVAVLSRTFPIISQRFHGIGSAFICTLSIVLCFAAFVVHGAGMDPGSSIRLACDVVSEGRMWGDKSLGRKATKFGAVFGLVCTHVVIPLIIVACQMEMELMASRGKVWLFGGAWHEVSHQADEKDDVENDPAPSLCDSPQESMGNLKLGGLRRKSSRGGVCFEDGLGGEPVGDISQPSTSNFGGEGAGALQKGGPGSQRRTLMDVVSVEPDPQAEGGPLSNNIGSPAGASGPDPDLFASMSGPNAVAIGTSNGVVLRASQSGKGWDALELDMESCEGTPDIPDRAYLGFETYPGGTCRPHRSVHFPNFIINLRGGEPHFRSSISMSA